MEHLIDRPSFIPAPSKRLRGSKAEGLSYERRIAGYLSALAGGRAVHNPWYKFTDDEGDGWCSPDVILLPKGDEPLVIFECKLTAVKGCEDKVRGLYLPVLQFLHPDTEIRTVQVAKNLRRGFEGYLIENWKSALAPNVEWEFATWNFQKPPR
ncbi:MAG: hypothetical protein JW384_01911 [Nitrosomonadaceae bacterium]|nr:hypothetical protein [Nitrosomonadaceae bacterium]